MGRAAKAARFGLSASSRYALRARVTTRAYLPMRLRRIRLAYLYYRAIGFRRYALMAARYALPRIRGLLFQLTGTLNSVL